MASPVISLEDLIEKFQLSPHQLDMELREEHLGEVSRIIDNHQIVGPELGLSQQEMTAVSSDVNGLELQKIEMLRKWKQRCAWKATYRKLIEAFLKCSRGDHARKVCELLTQSVPIASAGHSATSHQIHHDASSTDGAEHEYQKSSCGKCEACLAKPCGNCTPCNKQKRRVSTREVNYTSQLYIELTNSQEEDPTYQPDKSDEEEESGGPLQLIVKYPRVQLKSVPVNPPMDATGVAETELFRIAIDYKRKLGEGAVGKMYEGTWFGEDLPVPCAVKILSSPLAIRQSKREYKVASKLIHPNIVRYYHIYHPDKKKTILVIERMDLNLTQFLEKESNRNTIGFQIHASVGISSALCYLHGKGIIHRDLSSNNILLNKNTLDVKVANFGVSRILDEDRSPLISIPGTPNYMPPETFKDNPSYSVSLDIFSLGVLLIQLMTGLCPDPSEHQRVVDKHIIEEVEEHLRRKAHIDKIPHDHPLRDLALQCIQNDPTKRPTAENVSMYLQSKRKSAFLLLEQRIEELQQTLQEQKQEIHNLNDEIAVLTFENQEMEVREKYTMEWKQTTLELINDSFSQL